MGRSHILAGRSFKPSRLVCRHRGVASSPRVSSPTRFASTTSRSVRSARWMWSLVLWVVVALGLRGTTTVLHSHEGEATHLHVLLGTAGEHHDHHHVHDHDDDHGHTSICATPCGDDQLELSLPHLEATRLTTTGRWTAPLLLTSLPSSCPSAESRAAFTTAQRRWKSLVKGPPRKLQGGVTALLVSSRALLI